MPDTVAFAASDLAPTNGMMLDSCGRSGGVESGSLRFGFRLPRGDGFVFEE